MNEPLKHETGWKKRAALVVLLLAVAIGGIVWLAMPPKEPSYQGKPLSYWLARFETNGSVVRESRDSKDPIVIECRDAVRHIGTNAIPALLRILRAKDSAVKTKLMDLLEKQDFINVPLSSVEDQKDNVGIGFYLLGDLATNAAPALIDIYTHPPSDNSKEIADSALMQLYPAPCVETPYWVPPGKRAEWYFDAGELKSECGETNNAILAFSESIKLDPANVEAYLGRGGARLQLQDFAGAMPDLEKAMELSPGNENAIFAKGLCEFGLKDFKSAEADLTAALNLNTNDERIYNYRGLSRANLREWKAALADFSKAIEVSPGEADSYRNRALVENQQKEYELALADASKSIELDDHDANTYMLRGRAKTSLKDYKAALADLDKAIELNPSNSIAYCARGMDKVDMDDFDSAAADLEMSLQLNPRNPAAFMTRGVLNAKRGEDEAALADCQRAVELAPHVPETYGLLGLFQYKNSQWEPALANLHKALQPGAGGDVGELNAYIWLIHAQSGELDAANQELNDYLKSHPQAKTNEWSTIVIRFFTGRVPESDFLGLATTSAKRPSAVRSQVCESLYYAGMKRKIAGDKPGAVELLQKCVDTKYDNSIAYLNATVEMRALKQP